MIDRISVQFAQVFRMLLPLLISAAVLSACATKQQNAALTDANGNIVEDVNDPIEPFNRYIFEVNRFIDIMLLRPVAEIYRGAVPQPAQDGVRNVLNHLRTPLTFVHDVAQGEVDRAGQSFGRFAINSVAGVGGVFDVAGVGGSETGIPYHEEDFGQTLAVWGVGEGPYLVLPLFGPSNVRDAFGRIGDTFIDPIGFLGSEDTQFKLLVIRASLTAIDSRARNIETLDEIERSSIDYYATIRSLYRQRRRADIANGRLPPSDDSPDISVD